MVASALEPMVHAQIAAAVGLKYLVTRDKKTGKFIRVTEAMAKAKQGDHEETIEVWEKEPSTAAFMDLVNRTLDKPTEHIEHSGEVSNVPVYVLPEGARIATK